MPPPGRPKFRGILLLKCPYCLRTPLRKDRSWFEFAVGCENCNYRYEREPGYYTGAPWMICYPLVGILMLVLVSIFYRNFGLSSLKLSLVVSVVAVSSAILIFPYSRAIWMFLDHNFHPLEESDRLDQPAKSVPAP